MKSNFTDQAVAPVVEDGEKVTDPFAVDLFATSRQPADENSSPAAQQAVQAGDAQPTPLATSDLWHAAIPKISVGAARFSAQLAALPSSLSADAWVALAGVIARHTHVAPDEIQWRAVALHEMELASLAPTDAQSSRVFITIRVEPENVAVIAMLDAAFASAMVDRLLGGRGEPPSSLRALSATEQSVVEFLFLCVIHEMNVHAREPIFRLDTVAGNPPSFITARDAQAGASSQHPTEAARALVSTVRVQVASTTGLVRLVFDHDALAALDAAINPLLARAEDGESAGENLVRFKRFAGDAALRLQIGETQILASGLAELESGDVVVIERPLVKWRERRVAGEALVIAGGCLQINGVVKTRADAGVMSDASSGEGGALALAIESITRGAARADATERLEMEDERELAEDGEGTLALDGLLLTVHVELAARRISLEELSRLRAGQIIELNCRATDPVDLVAEGRRIATGELVDIEGQLGVRVTRLLG